MGKPRAKRRTGGRPVDAGALKRDTLVMNETQTFDTIIVGGGLAGGLAALALASRGFNCAIVDAGDPATVRNAAFDGRTTAISYASARVFRRLGLWDAVTPNAEPIRDILVTDGRAKSRFDEGAVSTFHLHFDSRELGDDTPLGWIVENRVLRNVLFDAIEKNALVTLFAPAKRAGAAFNAAHAIINLEGGQALKAALVVAADGRFSALRAEANIKTNQWRYPQTGIVATVAHEHAHEGVAQELFLPAGPFAILPMTSASKGEHQKKHRSSLVWTEHSDAAPAFMALDDDKFRIEIENRFGPYLGAVEPAGPRWSYPLAFTLAQSYIAPRLALIGDAAHAIHPIAGQGYNLGIKDVAALTDVLSEARDVGLEIGHLSVLQNYQRWRRFDSASLALGTDLLNRLFSNDIAPLRFARDIGMGAVGRVAPLRKFFMRQAGADLGALPSLMAREL
ncbi:UbiH/UbiF/VisC/COQ6 family ubiquinone biosynthesis hydroxylase [Hyphococcus flavus]|uniref:UbiH/UbiF/VisC/COQ6 family ubiquinone biosynthesis hydroxylase n=1 Tax=Hyphococcus flavus TaxID=1866326 RepID=A0AAE9ZLA9_9PROT|nr:UbiH/UbiF/VisC/COQ6 family ubiquinone biosynthesis hydroxylase [Hyphococcus flavus]WDI32730.1 UbiH/UbiF/VisC/COQ6 family ubiquinone biosynthesis hydroxylase [Hyphococcus flavus]